MAVQKRNMENTAAGKVNAASLLEWVRRFFRVSLYRNSLFLILNSVVPAVTGFAFWTAATGHYTAPEIGTASAAISVMTLLMFLSTFGLEYGLIRFLPEAGDGAASMVVSCLSVSAIAAMVLAAVFLAGIPVWAPALEGLKASPLMITAFIAFTTVFSVYSLVHHLFIARRRAGFALAQTVVFSLIRFLPLLLLAAISGTVIFTAWGMALTVALVVSAFFLIPRLGLSVTKSLTIRADILRRMLKFSAANFSVNFLWMLPGLVLPLMVTNMLGVAENAYFAIGWAVAGVVLMIPMGVSLSLFAEGSHDSENLPSDLARGGMLTVLLVAPAILAVWVSGEKVLSIFGRQYAENALPLVRLLAISALPAGVNYLYLTQCRVRKNMKGAIILSGLMAGVTLLVSAVLVPRQGIEGAGWGYLLGQSLPLPFATILLFRDANRCRELGVVARKP